MVKEWEEGVGNVLSDNESALLWIIPPDNGFVLNVDSTSAELSRDEGDEASLGGSHLDQFGNGGSAGQ